MSTADRPRTYGDLRRRTDDTRWELIDGEAYAMTGPSWQHQSVVMGLSAQLMTMGETFGHAQLFEARGVWEARGFEGLTIDWDQAFADVPAPR